MKPTHHRRDFVRTLALGVPAVSAATPLLGDEPARPERSRSEADARMEVLLARFGKHLDANARDTIAAEVEAIVLRAELLRKFPLTNGDGPCPVFIPFRDAHS